MASACSTTSTATGATPQASSISRCGDQPLAISRHGAERLASYFRASASPGAAAAIMR